MSAAASSRGLAVRLWNSYNAALDTRPLVTKSFTSFFGFIAGDAVAQVATGEKYDYWRTARFASYGLVIHGPLSHAWYGVLDKHVVPHAPKRYVVSCMFVLLTLPLHFCTPLLQINCW